jgi:WS/DGAT/MGAT family acyltransferase
MHIGALVMIDAAPLLDSSGRLRLDEIRRRLALRLPRVPVLRQRLFTPGRFQGRPLFVDADDFGIAHHVDEVILSRTAGEAELVGAAERLMGRLLDRTRPLWEMWFIMAPGVDRIGLVVKLHHAVADGRAAVAMLSSLFDLRADEPDPAPRQWSPEPTPSSWSLLADNASAKIGSVKRAFRVLAHPSRAAANARRVGRVLLHSFRGAAAPRSSINRVVAPGRRFRFARFDLAKVKDVAHAAGGKVNDVVLDLTAGALRELLLGRGENVQGVELIASIPVSLRTADEARTLGNAIGVSAVPVPVGELDARRRLESIVASTRQAKDQQHPAEVEAVVTWLAGTPIAQAFITRQRLVNTMVTNVAGPPAPVYMLGARVLDVVPIALPAGNVRISFCAFSYAGYLYLATSTDAISCPDTDRLITGAQREWHHLSAGQRTEGQTHEHIIDRTPAGAAGQCVGTGR